MSPRAPRAEQPTTERGINIPAPLLEVFAKINKANPRLAAPFASVIEAIKFAKPKPTAIDLNPTKALKVLATKDRPKPKQDLLAISARRNTIKSSALKSKASIFEKPKSFAEKSRFTRGRAEPTTPTDDDKGGTEGGTE